VLRNGDKRRSHPWVLVLLEARRRLRTPRTNMHPKGNKFQRPSNACFRDGHHIFRVALSLVCRHRIHGSRRSWPIWSIRTLWSAQMPGFCWGFYGAGLRLAPRRAVLRHCLLVPGLVSRTGYRAHDHRSHRLRLGDTEVGGLEHRELPAARRCPPACGPPAG
jgi:hypothetical protein